MKISYAYVEVTRACNERCVYCYNNSRDALVGELDTTGLCDALGNFRQQGGEAVNVTGGEALLRKDITAILEHSRGLGFQRIILSTNGLLLSTGRGQEALQFIDEIDVSLDGFQETHDLLRGVRSWERTLGAIGRAASVVETVHVNCCVTPVLLPRIQEFVDLMVSVGVTSLKLAEIGRSGRIETPAELLPPSDGWLDELGTQLTLLELRNRDRIRISQSRQRTFHPINPVNDGVLIDPCGRLFPQLGYLPLYWQIGTAAPWQLDESRIAEYLQTVGRVERVGIQKLREGDAVSWWMLIAEELERVAKAGGGVEYAS